MSDPAKLLVDHLDIWTGAIERKNGAGRGNNGKLSLYGVDKLRSLILDLAVHGKLVPQDPADGNAGELLRAYRAKKQKLLKEKRIRKQKVSRSICSDETIFEVPRGWIWARLGEIGFVCNGNSISAADKKHKYSEVSDYPFIATKDVGYGFKKLDYDGGVWIPADDAKFVVAPAGTTLICSEGGSAGKKCGFTERDVCFGNKLFAVNHYGHFEPKFLLAWYQTVSFFELFSQQMTGIIGGVSLAKFVDLPCPLPPLAEQKRIVAKVDELMALVDALEAGTRAGMEAHETLVRELLATLVNSQDAEDLARNWSRIEAHFDALFTTEQSIDALREAALDMALHQIGNRSHAATTGKRDATAQWPIVPLGQLLSFGPKNGLSPRAVAVETPVKTLTLTATTSGTFLPEHFKYVDIELPDDESEIWLKSGDILIQRANALNYVGVSAIYEGDDNEFIYPDLMIKIRTTSRILPRFALLVLNSKSVRDFFRANASGTSGSMPKINHKVLRAAPIVVPPIPEQERILALIEQIDSLRSALTAAILAQRRLEISIGDAVINTAFV